MQCCFSKGMIEVNKVIITGANGFIGSHITRMFCKNNIDVSCLVRKDSNLSNIKGLPVEIKTGDIRNLTSLEKAFKGYQCVIHNAAKVADWGNYNDFYQTNVTGTINVLKACSNANIKNVILTASNSVYGEENCHAVKDESWPNNSHYNYFMDGIFPCKLNYYRDTKVLGKSAAIKFAQNNELNLTIIEPVWVFGEREFNTGFYEYIKTAKTGVPFLPGSKNNKFHVIYAQDLAKAYLLVYKKQIKGVNNFIIGNKSAENMDYIYEIFCEEAEIKKPVNIPKALIYPIAFTLELLYATCKCKRPPILTRGRVNMFYDNIEYSINKAEKELGFAPDYTLEDAIRKTVLWYKHEGLI